LATVSEALTSSNVSVPPRELRQLRRERDRRRRAAVWRRRAGAFGALAVAVTAVLAAVLSSQGGSGTSARTAASARQAHHTGKSSAGANHARREQPRGTGVPGNAAVPILMYHVINPPPGSVPYPDLYVPAPEFAAQMQALKSGGWHAVTMNQLEANWSRGVPLGPGKPIVLSFDNGYASQYANAMPILKRLGWVGVENIQLSGLPPSEGGLTGSQVRGLLSAGWELDTQGISHADLITLGASDLHYQVATARQILRRRYRVPVNWFCYPSGHYNATVIAAVRAAGFVGSTTVLPGWATRSDDPFRLPRLRVLAGTTPSALLAQIAAAEHSPAPPASYGAT
jgi:peptidoglycan/xylan/chitin deacetylase (PgdA/CDA1 family)